MPHPLIHIKPPQAPLPAHSTSLCLPQDYTYYGLASPWLQVKCLRVLQYFPAPEEPSVRRTLVDVVKRILGGAQLAASCLVQAEAAQLATVHLLKR